MPGTAKPLVIDDAGAPVYTVGQVANMLGVRPAYLRRLDEFGVVTATRSSGNQRRYSREQIDQLIEVRSLMAEGLTLAGVRRVLGLQARVAELEAELAACQTRQRAEEPQP